VPRRLGLLQAARQICVSARVAVAVHAEEHDFVGRVEALTYDRFGAFEGFRLEEADGAVHRFASDELGIAELARRAWSDSARIEVRTGGTHPRRRIAISFVIRRVATPR
jgi:hypothetical protein